MKKIVPALMIVFVLCVLANSALALRLNTTSLDLKIKRGESNTQILDIDNDSSEPIICRVYATHMEVGKNGKRLFEEASETYSAAGWIKPKEPSFQISANGTKQAVIKITVPRRIKPGDYFATIMVESAMGTIMRGKMAIAVNSRLGCIVSITVPGTVKKKADVSELMVEMPSSESEEQTINIISTLKNNCRIQLDAQAQVVIKNSADRIFDRFILQGANKKAKGEAQVYPMGERKFSGTIQKPLPAGEYIAEVSFNFGSRRKAKAETTFVVSPKLGKAQEGLLVLTAEPNPATLTMPAGAFRTLSLRVENLEFEPIKVTATSQAPWLSVKPATFTVKAVSSRNLRLTVSTADNESTARVGKIVLTPERGKPIIVDVIVSIPKEKD